MFKECSICKNEKPLSQFRRDKTQRDGYQPRCKVCARAQHKSAYITKYGDKSRKRNAIRCAETRKKIAEYKESHPCIICNESSRVCLDFHHLDMNEKDFGISSNTGTRSWETVLNEISKCVVLCKNCHAKVHAGVLPNPNPNL